MLKASDRKVVAEIGFGVITLAVVGGGAAIVVAAGGGEDGEAVVGGATDIVCAGGKEVVFSPEGGGVVVHPVTRLNRMPETTSNIGAFLIDASHMGLEKCIVAHP